MADTARRLPVWGTEGVCRSAMGQHAVTAVRSLCRAAGQGLEWTEGAGEERESEPPSHVSTDTPSSPPLNTLTLSGHTEQRPPSLFSPLVLQQNAQRGKWQEC